VANAPDPTPSPLDTAEIEARAANGLATAERAALRRRLSPRWAFFTAAVIALLGGTLWLRYTAPAMTPAATAPDPRPNSIAVLPLVNASPDSGQEYFSDGMTEELTAALGRAPGLRVVAHSSARAVSRRSDDAREAGRRLNVGTVLEGSVRQANGRLRLNVHLVSVSEGFDLWSETYERPQSDIFAVQNEIARSVAAAMRVSGGGPVPVATPPTADLDAYSAYLRARYALGPPGASDPSRAAALFQEAIGLDSTFAPAWAGLADAEIRRAIEAGARPAEAMPAARTAAIRAIALDSSLAVAEAALGVVRFLYDWEAGGADSAFQRAVAINPNRPETHDWYSRFLAATGRADEGLLHARRALELSPLDPGTIALLAWHSLHAKRYAEAREDLTRALAVDSSRTRPRYLLGLLAEVLGDYELAESYYRAVLDREPDDLDALAALGRTHALDGRPAEARAMLARLDTLSGERYVSPYLLSGIAETLGDKRRAFAWLEEAVDDRAAQPAYLALDPLLDGLRADRRFARIERSVGLP
jgi:TolB-like protein/Tfp pilus assembly protein PilF